MDSTDIRNLYIELCRLEQAFGADASIIAAVNAAANLCALFGLDLRLDGSSQLDGVPFEQRFDYITKKYNQLDSRISHYPHSLQLTFEQLLQRIHIGLNQYAVAIRAQQGASALVSASALVNK